MLTSWDYYRVFYHVAECGSLSGAARRLLCNQPNLTREIRNLESELGCSLFTRTNRGMRLTPDGEQLYARVRVAYASLEAGEAELRRSRELQSGTVSVAASEVALRCHLLPVLQQYRLRYPGVRIRISNHSTPQALDALQCGLADLAVVTTPTQAPDCLTEIPVRTVREVLLGSSAFPELLDRPVHLWELAHYPFVSLGPATKSFAVYAALFAAHSMTYRVDLEVSTADQLLPMVEAGLGLGFVAERLIRPSDRVTILQLAEEIPTRSVCLLKRKEHPLSTAAQALEDMIAAPVTA